MKAVRFDAYGGISVLRVSDVPIPQPQHGEALVRVKATSINPGEAKIREGAMHARFPATFPSGEGSDVAGIVAQIGPGVEDFGDGDEVIGFTNQRASHAEYVIVEAQNLTPKPANVSWEAAGSLAVAGCTAYAAVRAVNVQRGNMVAVSGAAGGVGSIAVQLARRAGAQVLGIAASDKHEWLAAHGVTPIAYGASLVDRLHEANVDAFIDTYGVGYVKLAIELGVAPNRIDTIADFVAVQEYGVKVEGSSAGMSAETLAELARLIAAGELDVPIAATFPLDDVQAAFALLAQGHTLGKIVLLP